MTETFRGIDQALKSNGHLRLSLLLGRVPGERVELAMKEALSKREARIIELRFSSQFHKTYTRREIGQIYKITAERVRQIEAKALEKMRDYLRCYH